MPISIVILKFIVIGIALIIGTPFWLIIRIVKLSWRLSKKIRQLLEL